MAEPVPLVDLDTIDVDVMAVEPMAVILDEGEGLATLEPLVDELAMVGAPAEAVEEEVEARELIEAPVFAEIEEPAGDVELGPGPRLVRVDEPVEIERELNVEELAAEALIDMEELAEGYIGAAREAKELDELGLTPLVGVGVVREVDDKDAPRLVDVGRLCVLEDVA